MATTKLKNGQLPDTISSKTVDNTNDINTTTARLKITGGSNGQVLSTDGSGNLSWATAGGGGRTPIATITKTAHETVYNSTTLQADNHLFYNSLSSGKIYIAELFLIIDRDTDDYPNSKIKVSIETNFAGAWKVDYGTSWRYGDIDTAAIVSANIDSFHTTFSPMKLTATINGTYSNSIGLYWACGEMNSYDVTIRKGSYLEIYEAATF